MTTNNTGRNSGDVRHRQLRNGRHQQQQQQQHQEERPWTHCEIFYYVQLALLVICIVFGVCAYSYTQWNTARLQRAVLAGIDIDMKFDVEYGREGYEDRLWAYLDSHRKLPKTADKALAYLRQWDFIRSSTTASKVPLSKLAKMKYVEYLDKIPPERRTQMLLWRGVSLEDIKGMDKAGAFSEEDEVCFWGKGVYFAKRPSMARGYAEIYRVYDKSYMILASAIISNPRVGKPNEEMDEGMSAFTDTEQEIYAIKPYYAIPLWVFEFHYVIIWANKANHELLPPKLSEQLESKFVAHPEDGEYEENFKMDTGDAMVNLKWERKGRGAYEIELRLSEDGREMRKMNLERKYQEIG